MVKAAKGKTAKKIHHKFVVNCRLPIEDNIIVLSDFENYLAQRIKVEGKTGNLGTNVTVSKDKDSLVVEAKIALSKRYIKYLTKKYLKKQEIREYLRVVATGKNSYELKYPDVNQEEAE